LSAIRFYVDHHVHWAITKGLRLRGVDCLTAEEDSREDEDDAELLARATQLGRVVVTQDDDFLVIATDWISAGTDFAGIVYSHQLGITIGQAISDLEMIAKVQSPSDLMNEVVYIPL
jgi:Domain of unknown function (DUF5615)